MITVRCLWCEPTGSERDLQERSCSEQLIVIWISYLNPSRVSWARSVVRLLEFPNHQTAIQLLYDGCSHRTTIVHWWSVLVVCYCPSASQSCSQSSKKEHHKDSDRNGKGMHTKSEPAVVSIFLVGRSNKLYDEGEIDLFLSQSSGCTKTKRLGTILLLTRTLTTVGFCCFAILRVVVLSSNLSSLVVALHCPLVHPICRLIERSICRLIGVEAEESDQKEIVHYRTSE